ncbi:MAG TPA: DNA-processing protein DprA [Candidatus Polarisedimenticolia bacterium]
MLTHSHAAERRAAWVALGLLLTVHPRLKRTIHPGAVDPAGLLAGSAEALEGALSLRPPEARDIFSGDFPEMADKEISAAGKAGVSIVTWEDESYPPGLRYLPDPPPFLYVRGALLPRDADAVAVVGSRRGTPYGIRVAERIASDLAGSGITVVSGLARGVDTAAHRGALAGAGRTIGVLGSGIDVVYPGENRRLFAQVPAAGAVVTEFPFGTGPLPRNFPVRNRIIAGLASAVLVVEAARDSGSLITAMLAAETLGIPVCAVPGPITSKTSEGCNDLIFDGVTPVRGVEDILHVLPDAARERARRLRDGPEGKRARREPPADLAEGARRVLHLLDLDLPRSADELARTAGVAGGALLGHLLELEVKGLAGQLPGGLYIRKR